MQPFNVEIFDRQFNLIQHYNVGAIDYNYDYLSTVENSILIEFNENVEKGDYIRIVNNTDSYFGFISSIAVNEAIQGFSEIRFKPFIALFDAPIMFDTTLQGSGTSLENAIAGIITDYWINNADADENIYGLEVQTLSTTSNWGFHITSDQKGLNKAIINFMTSIIRRSLTKYQVGLYAEPDFTNKKVVVSIGVKALNTFYIEADLPNVIEKSIIVNETTEDMNKLFIYDQADLVTNVIYYKHPDGSYDTRDEDRITPVIYGITSVAVSEGDTFADVAEDAANKQFDVDTYSNLIEITVQNEDEIVMPQSLTIGQIVNVISNGTSYSSILTGVERSNKTKLIFGTIRLDLTKIIKGGL
jgi:hypothetical protein